MNKKKIRRLMNKYGLKCPIRKANPYRRMANALRTNSVTANHVNREFREHGARSIILTDITYIRLNDGFCYLSVMMDAYTKQVLSHQLNRSLEVDFVLRTVEQLIAEHGEELPENVYIHSDQGCHYTSIAFRELLRNVNLRQSMSRRGNCWDNAPQESFFGTMKEETKPYIKECKAFDQLHDLIDDWIDYYNNDRLVETLNEMAPNEFYQYLLSSEEVNSASL